MSIRTGWRRLLCRVRGHVYDTPHFRADHLYFCSRCGREMFDRTFDDLRKFPPFTAEELLDQQRIDELLDR